MKKFVKSFFVTAAALLLMAGCSNIAADDATVSGMSEGGETTLKISIEGREDSSARNASRMINPTPYLITDTFDQIILTGVSETQATINEDLTDDLNGGGTASVTLSSSIWYLTLSAYKGSDIVLQGRKRVDIKAGVPSTGISFELTADGLDAPGAVDLTINFADGVTTTLVSSVKAGLYAVGTNEVIDEQDFTTAAINYTKDALKPGRYSFVVTYYNAAGNKIGVWGDVVAVAPGRTTTHTEAVPDVLAKVPKKPSDFHAYLVDDSENVNGTYRVLFTWTRDALKNEENFEITLKTYDGTGSDATATTYKIFGIEDDATNKKYVFFENADRIAGSLNATEESCIITLPTGTLFDASIKAQNFVGDSESVNRTAATAAATGTLPDGTTAIPDNTPFGDSKINRAKIILNLNGGTYQQKDATGLLSPITGTVVKYGSYFDTDKTLATLLPVVNGADDAVASYPKLKIDSTRPFLGWLTSTSGGTAVTSYDYQDLTVYANYDLVQTGIGYSVVDEWGTISASATAAGTLAAFNSSTKTLEFTASTNQDLTFSVPNTDGDITEISYKIDNELGDTAAVASGATTASIVFDKTELLGSRTHTVVVSVTKGGKVYGDVIYVKIMR